MLRCCRQVTRYDVPYLICIGTGFDHHKKKYQPLGIKGQIILFIEYLTHSNGA